MNGGKNHSIGEDVRCSHARGRNFEHVGHLKKHGKQHTDTHTQKQMSAALTPAHLTLNHSGRPEGANGNIWRLILKLNSQAVDQHGHGHLGHGVWHLVQ